MGTITHTCNLSTLEAKAERSQVQSQVGLHSESEASMHNAETLSQKKSNNKKKNKRIRYTHKKGE